MRRGGVLTLLIGLLLIVGAGVAFFLFFPQGTTGVGGGAGEVPPTPTEDPGVEVLIVLADRIPANTVLNNAQDYFETENIPSSEYKPDTDITSFSDVEGKLLIRELVSGARLEQSMLTEPGLSQQIPTPEPNRPRPKAYPLVVTSLSGVADQIKPGDFVDVVVTYKFKRPVAYTVGRTVDPETGIVTDQRVVETAELFDVTKTIAQQVQVLRILRPAVIADTTPQAAPQSSGGGPGSAQPEAVATAVPGSTAPDGSWTLIIAVSDQEAELLEFARNTVDTKISLVLRGAGDSVFEPTIGVTYDLLVSEFGVPAPRWIDPLSFASEDTLEPDPSPTPAPTRIP